MSQNFVFERIGPTVDPFALRVGVIEAPSLFDALTWAERRHRQFDGAWTVREVADDEARSIVTRLVPPPVVH